LIADGDTYASIEEIAAGRHTSPQLLWLKICADEGFEACEPWPGFPGLPKDFSMAGTVAPEHPLTAQLREKLTRFAG